jgi:hypothetical protein
MKDDPVRDAAEARTDLTIFHAVIAILEGGTLSARSYDDAQRIIGICKAAGGKRLRDYDRARGKARSPAPTS